MLEGNSGKGQSTSTEKEKAAPAANLPEKEGGPYKDKFERPRKGKKKTKRGGEKKGTANWVPWEGGSHRGKVACFVKKGIMVQKDINSPQESLLSRRGRNFLNQNGRDRSSR